MGTKKEKAEAEAPVDPAPVDPPVDPAPESEPGEHGVMASTEALGEHQPEDAPKPFRDVDERPEELTIARRRGWDSPNVMVEKIRAHVKQSHGLEEDKALLRDVAQFLADMYSVPESS